jgi:hypothetical protein
MRSNLLLAVLLIGGAAHLGAQDVPPSEGRRKQDDGTRPSMVIVQRTLVKTGSAGEITRTATIEMSVGDGRGRIRKQIGGSAFVQDMRPSNEGVRGRSERAGTKPVLKLEPVAIREIERKSMGTRKMDGALVRGSRVVIEIPPAKGFNEKVEREVHETWVNAQSGRLAKTTIERPDKGETSISDYWYVQTDRIDPGVFEPAPGVIIMK